MTEVFVFSGPKRHTTLEGLNVLIVEDDDDARELLRTVLETCAMNVLEASSVEEALVSVQTQRLDLIISDIGMPQKDGYFFIQEVRASPVESTATIPAMALTAFTRHEDRVRALRAGFDAYMVKPFEQVKLLMSLSQLVWKPEL
jgi:CheY-like chemotaxis protein